MKKQNAHFDVSDILYLALTLTVSGIAIAYGLSILSETKAEMCDSGYTYSSSQDTCLLDTNNSITASSTALNATKNSILGVAKFTDKFGLIATVIVAAILIGILVRYLFVKR